MKVDFNKLKTEISLPDFLVEHFGWKHDKGSSRQFPKLKAPDGQVIVIKRNQNGIYTYFDVHNDTIKGNTILDFMQRNIFNHTGKFPTLREVGEVLQGYVNSGKTILPDKSTFSMNREFIDKEEIFYIINNLKPINDLTFLKERGIEEKTLDHPTWSNVFYENTYYDKERNSSYKNTCVKLQNVNGVQGLSQRNLFFKGALGNRYDSIAASNFNKKMPISNLYIGESMIDCISHWQMNNNPEKNNLYLSTEGQITEGQINTINNVLNNYIVENIIPIFDNDKAGQSYNLKLLGNLGKDNFNYIVSVVHNKTENNVYVQLSVFGKKEMNDKVVKELFSEEILKNYFDNGSYKITEVSNSVKEKFDTNETKYEISFPFQKEVLTDLAQNIGNKKFGKSFNIELSKNSDFNDDLKQNIQTQKSKKNNNQIAM